MSAAKVVMKLAEMPACIRDSIRTCLAAHGMTLSPELLVELGNNVAQGLTSLDEGLDTDPNTSSDGGAAAKPSRDQHGGAADTRVPGWAPSSGNPSRKEH